MLRFRITGLLILYVSINVQAELDVGFTEVIFQGRESQPCLRVAITREGELNQDVEVGIHPLTYQQFLESGFLLPDVPELWELPDPAEYEPEGEDFSTEVQTITLHSHLEREDHLICIALNPDTISEANEGLFLVLSIDENYEVLQENQVALAVILDDDSVEVGFEQLSYTCREGEPENSCVICVALGGATELEKGLEIPLISLTHSSTARVSEDYLDASQALVLSSSQQRVCLEVHVLDDDVAEREEGFMCILSQTDSQSLPTVRLERGVTSVTIQDNDAVGVGFEQDEYACRDGHRERCRVCVSILSSASHLDPTLSVSLSLSSISRTAIAGLDFEGINERVTLSAGSPRVCVPVQTADTNKRARDRNLFFECILLKNVQPNSFSNVFLERETTTVKIKGHLEGDRCLGVGGKPVCHEKAICHDELEGGVLCECLDGYMGDGVSSCTDVDECEEGLDDCGHEVACHVTSAGREMCRAVASCVNTHGSYQCTCATGYTGDGRNCTAIERPVNECHQGIHNCHLNAHCEDTPNGFLCHCGRGFTGDGIECTDVDECKSGRHGCDNTKFCHFSYASGRVECVHTAECLNTHGSYECSCRTGFTGDGTACTDVDECRGPTECDANANCLNIPGGYHCQCKEGYVGVGTLCTATAVASGCSLEPTICSLDAACEEIEGNSLCICNPGFEGDGHTCTDVDECVRPGQGRCGPAAVCKNTPGSFLCVCEEGFVGDGHNCTRVLIDECALGTDDCAELNSVCVDKEEGYSCVCRPGYRDTGSSKCIDIDECSEGLDGCSSSGRCLNTEGAYECYCLPGYEGDGFTCTDIDECLQDLTSCSPLAECINTVGSYECECLAGFDGDGKTCTDIDECTLGTDGCNGSTSQCINSPGSFLCVCLMGFRGNGLTCTDIDECAEGLDNCDANADCVNTDRSFLCICQEGYEGDGRTCRDVDECSEDVDECSSNSGCLNTEGAYECYCLPGYEGDGFTCTDIDECANGACSSYAECTNTPGSFFCICHVGYQGDGITCTDIDECAEGTDTCDGREVCREGSCRRVGQCTNTRGSYKCSCSPGFTGNSHSCLDVDECKRQLHNCHTQAACTNTVGGFQCVCRRGFIGSGTTCLPVLAVSQSPCDMTRGYANWLKCRGEGGPYHDTRKAGTNPLSAGDKGSRSFSTLDSVEMNHQLNPSNNGNGIADHPSKATQTLSPPLRNNIPSLSTEQSETMGDSRGKGIHRTPKYVTKLRVWQPPGPGLERGYAERGSSHGYFHTKPWQGNGEDGSSTQNRQWEMEGQDTVSAVDHYQKMLDRWSEDEGNRQLARPDSNPTQEPRVGAVNNAPLAQKDTHPLHRSHSHYHHHTTTANNHHSNKPHHQAYTHHGYAKTIEQQKRGPRPLARRPSSKPPQSPNGQRHPGVIQHADPNTADNDVWFRVPGDVSVQLSKH